MIVTLLLDTQKDENGLTPIESVARNGHETIIKALLDTGMAEEVVPLQAQLILDVIILRSCPRKSLRAKRRHGHMEYNSSEGI